jgi:Flp pilus assembly protein TadG
VSALRGCRGQVAVELCVLAPLLAVVGLGVCSALSVAQVAIDVEHALDAAVIAGAEGRDPAAAASRALPAGLRRDAAISRVGGRLLVSVPRQGLVPAYAASADVPR